MAKPSPKRRRRDEAFASATGDIVPFPVHSKRPKREKSLAVDDPSPQSKPKKDWQCATAAQKRYKQKIVSSTITFGIGPAGVGKSLVATMIAAQMLDEKKIERIVVTRPAVSDEDYGALPGEIGDKIAPWFAPVLDLLNEYFGASHVENLIRLKKIVFVPMGHLKGLTFRNSFILLDEGQNTRPKQMKGLITRLGHNSILVIDGDLDQTDIPGTNGLEDAMRRLGGIEGVSFAYFTEDDIVRHGILKDILKAYRNPKAAVNPADVATE